MIAELRQFRLLVLAFTLIMLGCQAGDNFELKLVQSVDVDFQALRADTPTETDDSAVRFNLLDDEDYLVLREQLTCGVLDPFDSRLSIETLAASGLESVIDLRVSVAASPDGPWLPLAELTAMVSERDVLPFNDPGFTISVPGLDVLEDIVLSDKPTYFVKVATMTAEPVMDLEVNVELALQLSNRIDGCPSRAF